MKVDVYTDYNYKNTRDNFLKYHITIVLLSNSNVWNATEARSALLRLFDERRKPPTPHPAHNPSVLRRAVLFPLTNSTDTTFHLRFTHVPAVTHIRST